VDDRRWEMVGSSAMGLWLPGWALVCGCRGGLWLPGWFVVVVAGVVVVVVAGVRCG
jgi:hypothetical protein